MPKSKVRTEFVAFIAYAGGRPSSVTRTLQNSQDLLGGAAGKTDFKPGEIAKVCSRMGYIAAFVML